LQITRSVLRQYFCGNWLLEVAMTNRILLGVLLLSTSTCQPEPPAQAAAPSAVVVKPTGSPTTAIHDFLTWYEQHQTQLNSLPVVPAALDEDTTQVFAVDFRAVEDYLRLLESSQGVSATYLQAQRRYFQQCQDSLLAHSQTDGLVEGLDYDRLLYTQAADEQTRLVLRSKPASVRIRADTAQVIYRWREDQLSEGPNLAFSLAVERGHWLIKASRPCN
jgi:hypothetical protein